MSSKHQLATSTWGDDEIAAMNDVISEGNFTMGKRVKLFERNFAEFIKAKYCVMVNSGSSANLLMIAALFYSKQIQQDETKKEILLQEVLLQMTQYSIGCCFFINEQKELVGVLSDGDIRRLLLNDMEKKYISINDINTDFYYETDMNKLVSDITLIKRKKFIPILSNDMRMIGIIKF